MKTNRPTIAFGTYYVLNRDEKSLTQFKCEICFSGPKRTIKLIGKPSTSSL